ncbi:MULTISPECIES: hypothetical protein [Planobispora]|uniref:RacP protein n=2 Tax=Planobispora TaxID=29298 RepID=A0A8J3WYA8_9ACTN|nr:MULTISPECIES: hypothetical protein [Planobispora]GIH97967.1 hypothetical protein Psi01_85970 [Planobispora siamensis]GII06160.1 hypothetical protein Pta02_81680 [Planobispora takensis]
MSRSGGRLAANVCAERVLLALSEARPAGLSTKQLVAATALSPYQVRKGLLYIREIAAMANLTPITWTAGQGWKLSADPAEWTAYAIAVFHQLLTRTSRLITSTIAPHAAALPGDDNAQMVLDQITGIKATLTLLTRGR